MPKADLDSLVESLHEVLAARGMKVVGATAEEPGEREIAVELCRGQEIALRAVFRLGLDDRFRRASGRLQYRTSLAPR
jgi:hypothetical protein